MRLASLAMYVAPPCVADATEALWRFLAAQLASAGMTDVPAGLDRLTAHDAAWLRPDLLLSQTCGYPYVTGLRNRVRLVATPCYAYPGCSGPAMCSFVVARQAAGLTGLAELRGTIAAVNAADSNSGSNLFRAAIAPLAGGRPFFDRVIETGGHVASLAAVSAGRADCAAIDCITFGHLARFAPERLDGLVVVAETPSGPGLPLITGLATSDADLERLRAALDAALVAPDLKPARDVLALTGFARLDDADYQVLADLQRRAEEAGYPHLA